VLNETTATVLESMPLAVCRCGHCETATNYKVLWASSPGLLWKVLRWTGNIPAHTFKFCAEGGDIAFPFHP